ncbi:MAG: HAD family hydrolase [Enterocloster sp.]
MIRIRPDKKRIVSFDLDMTLLDHKTWKVPDSAMEAIRLLRRDSIIVIASGRNMDHELSVGFQELIKPDAVIHLNGTRVVAEGEILYEHLMDRQRLHRLLAYAQENGISLGLSLDSYDYFTNPDNVIEYDKKRWGSSDRNFRDPWELEQLPVRTLVYIGGPERIEELETAFPDMKFPLFSGRMGADVVEQEASKAKGLERLCRYYGIDRSQTVAFGDSMNDFEIICEAGIGVAMGNAVEELKAAADYVTDSIERDGVWNACRYLGLI